MSSDGDMSRMESVSGLDSWRPRATRVLADRLEEALCFPDWPGWEHCVGCICRNIGNCSWVAVGVSADGDNQRQELREVGA